MQLIDSTCPLCLEPDIALNTALMRHGPEQTAQTRRLEAAAATEGGILFDHWQHLKTAIALPTEYESPAFDADPLIKTRWAQQQLFRLTFGANEIYVETPSDQIGLHRTKQSTLSSLLGAIRLEAELLGHVEAAKIKGKRRAEREVAREESAEDKLLNREEQLKLYAATMRLNGYEVTKNVNQDAIEVETEETDAH